MSIARRTDGRWLVKYKFNGSWKQRTFRTRAEAKLFDSEQTIEQAAEENLSVGELVTTFLRSVPHHRNYVCAIKMLLMSDNGEGRFLFDRFVETLTRRDLERLRENLRTRNIKNITINKYVAMLEAAFSWGVEQDFISNNPWRKYKPLPYQNTPIEVSKDDFKAVYAIAPDWMKWAMKTTYCLCLRPGMVELFSLKWDSFNFARGTVTVIQGKTRIPKTVVPPVPYMNEAKERFTHDRSQGIEYVCTKNGQQVTKNVYQGTWKRTCRKAGIKMRTYDIRHLAATSMLSAGSDLISVAAQLGHQNCATTGRFYAHATQRGQQIAAQALTI